MRRWPIVLIGALALALPAMGLVEVAGRAGPIDTTLEPVKVDARATGSFETRGDTAVAGLCAVPPCDATSSIQLRIDGLPSVPYTARLVGPSAVDLGPLGVDGDAVVLDWTDDQDHSDKRRLELRLAGRPIAAWALVGERTDLGGPVAATWGAPPASVHLAEIGMVSISTIATATLSEPPPSGWHYRAELDGAGGRIDLGPLEGDGTALDGRAERVPLEDQERIVIRLEPSDGAWDGFPVLAADLLTV